MNGIVVAYADCEKVIKAHNSLYKELAEGISNDGANDTLLSLIKEMMLECKINRKHISDLDFIKSFQRKLAQND